MGFGDRRYESDDSSDDTRRRRRRKKHRKRRRDELEAEESDDNRRRTKDRKKDRKKYRRDDSASNDSSYSQDDDDRKHKRKSRKKKKRRESDSNSLTNDNNSEDSRDYRARKKDRKKDRKKGSRMRDTDPNRDIIDESLYDAGSRPRNELAIEDALFDLFTQHDPVLASDLPIMLVRLASGQTLDFSQMDDKMLASRLSAIFTCLEPYGVKLQADSEGIWMWESPTAAANQANYELVLVKVVRTLLDQAGLTMQAIEDWESRHTNHVSNKQANLTAEGEKSLVNSESSPHMLETETTTLLEAFASPKELAGELAGLVQMMLEGGSLVLDALPDEKLRNALESLFTYCGLEKSEVEVDDDDEEESSEKEEQMTAPSLGFGLPESSPEVSEAKLKIIIQTCKSVVERESKPKIKGPCLPPKNYEPDSDGDDEGPLPVGAAPRKASSGAGAILPNTNKELVQKGGREEWMLVPGKFDFLKSIQAGQPITNRAFSSKKGAGGTKKEAPVDPAIRSQIDAIRHQHDEARGPSLMEQHRANKLARQQEASGEKKQWQWKRETDLDANRRVDKHALQQILGGAKKDLKSKFQSGY